MTLPIPQKVIDQHAAFLGKTGAGKSSVMRLFAEFLLEHNKRMFVLDPKGDWFGLKLSADGRGAGYPVVALGHFKEPRASDIPITDRSGKHVAELIASGNRPAVIGMRGWMPSQMARFWIDFASTLFNSNTGAGIYGFIDEIQNFAPKERAGFGEENMALHWTKKMLSEGRGLGLSFFVGSQRPQSVHNGVLTQCETLFAMKLVHPNDIAAVELWLSGTKDKAKRAEIISSISDLQRGEAWVWSPEVGFGPERVKFPLFRTFDSFAPPQQQKKVSESAWADVDLAAVKEKLATVIEEQKANDPAELKKRIADLQRQLAAKPPTVTAPAQRVEVPVFSEDDRRMLDKACADVAHLSSLVATVQTIGQTIAPRLEQLASIAKGKNSIVIRPECRTIHLRSIPPARLPREGTSRDPEVVNGTKLPRAESSILRAIAQRHPRPCTRAQAAIISGYSITSSSFSNALSALRSGGHIEGTGDDMRLTEHGRGTVSADLDNKPTGPAEMQAYYLSKLPKAEGAILGVLIEEYPSQIDREVIASRTGYSETSSSFSNALSTLRTLELITRDRAPRATEILFEP